MIGRDPDQDVFRRHATSVDVLLRLPGLGRMNRLAWWAEQLARRFCRSLLPAARRIPRASPSGCAAWHSFSALTPTCWCDAERLYHVCSSVTADGDGVDLEEHGGQGEGGHAGEGLGWRVRAPDPGDPIGQYL